MPWMIWKKKASWIGEKGRFFFYSEMNKEKEKRLWSMHCPISGVVDYTKF